MLAWPSYRGRLAIPGEWVEDLDSNQDSEVQSLTSYRWTIFQWSPAAGAHGISHAIPIASVTASSSDDRTLTPPPRSATARIPAPDLTGEMPLAVHNNCGHSAVMKPFTKLFASIVSSSIWQASKETKVVWVTMLAMADKEGEVWASVGGLANMAGVTKEECAKAVLELESPDDDSRTKLHEGRRIVPIDGGWRLLNYKKYRELGRAEDRREYFAEHKRQSRSTSTPVHNCPQTAPMSPIAEGDAEEEANTEREGEAEAPPPTRSRDDLQREVLESLGASTTDKEGDILPQWKKATKGLKEDVIRDIFKTASPGITWPSEFKKWRAARVSY